VAIIVRSSSGRLVSDWCPGSFSQFPLGFWARRVWLAGVLTVPGFSLSLLRQNASSEAFFSPPFLYCGLDLPSSWRRLADLGRSGVLTALWASFFFSNLGGVGCKFLVHLPLFYLLDPFTAPGGFFFSFKDSASPLLSTFFTPDFVPVAQLFLEAVLCSHALPTLRVLIVERDTIFLPLTIGLHFILSLRQGPCRWSLPQWSPIFFPAVLADG